MKVLEVKATSMEAGERSHLSNSVSWDEFRGNSTGDWSHSIEVLEVKATSMEAGERRLLSNSVGWDELRGSSTGTGLLIPWKSWK